MFRLERIREIGERFLTCGDYRLGVARIRCDNPGCGHDYFRPFSCKGFYLCPSCSQKRTLLFAEHLTNEVLLDLPHRQFVFTMPKVLCPFLRHHRRLFAELSRLIWLLVEKELLAEEVSVNARKREWARLFAKVYEIEPPLCPKCGWEMTVIAVIQDPVEIRDILAHLVKTGRAPPGFDPALLN